MKKLTAILLLSTLCLAGCAQGGARSASTQSVLAGVAAETSAPSGQVPTQTESQEEQADGPAPNEAAPTGSYTDPGFDIGSPDLTGHAVNLKEGGFALLEPINEEGDGVDYGMAINGAEPSLTVSYTNETQWGALYYNIADDSITLGDATASELAEDVFVYLWGTMEGDAFFADRILFFRPAT